MIIIFLLIYFNFKIIHLFSHNFQVFNIKIIHLFNHNFQVFNM